MNTMKSTLYLCLTIVLIFSNVRPINASNNSTYATGTGTRSTSSYIYGTFLLVLSILVILCNGIVVFVILKTDNPFVSNLAIIAHMALWDLIQGLIVLVFATPSAFLNRFAYSESMMSWQAALVSFVIGVGMFNTVTLVLDRIISLKKPFLHRKHATKPKYAFIGFCVYIMAFIQMLLMTLTDANIIYNQTIALCVSSSRTTQGSLAFAIPAAISFGVILVSVYVILREVSRRKNRLHSELVIPVSGNVKKRSLICVLSAGVFCLSYVPIVVQVVLHAILKNAFIDELFSKFAVVSYFSNSIWNVLIYSVTYKPFREAFLKLFCRSYYRRIKRQSQLQTNPNNTTGVSRINFQNPQVDLIGDVSFIPPESVNMVSLKQPENHGGSGKLMTTRLNADNR